MLLNYTYRIRPNQQQAQLLNEWLATLRVSYNYALRELKDWIASRKCSIDRCSLESEYIMSADYPFPSYHQQQNNLPDAKKTYPRLKSVPSQVLQTNIRRLHDAWDFFRERGYGFPRFKKYGQMKSMLFPQFRSNPITDWHLQLPKVGKVEFNQHRPIPDGFTVRQIRIIKKAKGWFATITLYSDVEVPSPSPRGRAIGVDVGLLSYLATSDGFVEPGRKFFKTEQSRLKVLQRRLAKKKKRSKNYEKARQRVEKQHNHIAFKRKDYQFKLANKLCDMTDTIFVEDIDFRTMAKGFLGKHSLDAAFGQFRTILEFVGKKRDVFVGRVDHRGTSQTCPNCRITVRKGLSERTHSCPECGYEADRDVASAQEICNRGIETYRGTPEKQEIGSQVEVSGAMCLGNWRRGAIPSREARKPAL
ncbi:MAG: RNA-guided endonuclease InsQ/TnpB family protein [Halothece sp.]